VNRIDKVLRLGKIFWNYKTHATVLPYLPLRLWVETTNQCNLRCKVCPNATDTTSIRGNMDLALFESIVEQLDGKANDINLSHRGEPLYHPHLETMIRMAARRGIATRIHTNATMLDKDRTKDLLDSQPDLISFSFDGYDKESYESVRIGGHFEETLENIKYFLATKKQRNLKKPYTVIQIIKPDDADETYHLKLSKFGQEMSKAGLDKFYIKNPHNWAGNAPGSSKLAQQYLVCTFLYYSMTVLWDGEVCPCPQDWYAKMPLGNLNDQSIREVWNGSPICEMRRRAVLCDLQGYLCENCDRVFRKSFIGIPTENLKAFFGETLAGYNLIRKLIRN